MKIVIVTDSHFGVRSQSPRFLKQSADFFRSQFFPYLKKVKPSYVIHAGDLVDNRKYITYETSRVLRESYIEPMIATGIPNICIPGNHDAPFKSNIEINAMREMLPQENFDSFIFPEEMNLGGVNFLFLPWICKSNEKETMEALEESDADVVIGHLELFGFEQYRGMPAAHGMGADKFSRFKQVYSGHYHHPSEQGNIRYLGAPYQMTWGDYDCPRGFHVYDTDTRQIEFINNPVEMFKRIEYDDSSLTTKQIMKEDFSKYADKIVKVVVNKRENKKGFDQYLDQIEKSGSADIQIVDNTVHKLDTLAPPVDEAKQTTLEIMLDCVNEFDDSNDKIALGNLLKELYSEASNMEV